MISSVAIIGRPNVGKSSLFNKLTKSRSAIVSNSPGVTKDRNIGYLTVDENRYLIIDTGGIGQRDDQLDNLVSEQAWVAAKESNLISFIVDGSEELTAQDHEILKQIRKLGSNFYTVINKADIKSQSYAKSDLLKSGISNLLNVSAEHSIGINDLKVIIQENIEPIDSEINNNEADIRVAIIGRPNSGKSTFINSVTGTNRLLVSDLPGTTIDSIEVPLKTNDHHLVMIDTAGIRRKNRQNRSTEYFSYVKTLDAIHKSNIALLFIDATLNLVDQDLRILNLAKLEGKPIVLVMNKMDKITKSLEQEIFSNQIFENPILQNTQVVKISALTDKKFTYLLNTIIATHDRSSQRFSTSKLNNLLTKAKSKPNIFSVSGKSIQIKYIHFGRNYPTTLILHSNHPSSKIPGNLKRYLRNFFYEHLDLKGVELSLIFKKATNPYKNKKNELNTRQLKKKKRLLKHRKTSKK